MHCLTSTTVYRAAPVPYPRLASGMMWLVQLTLVAVALAPTAADEDDDDDAAAASVQVYVDVNPSTPSNATSNCATGSYGAAEPDCEMCPDTRTTEVWSLQPAGALGCTVPADDEDGEDSDDWLPSLAACKSTCVGTCPGIVWTEPASPTSCLRCTAETQWTVPSGEGTEVHKRLSYGATLERQCDFCTDGLTLIDSVCEKTGVCSTIGPVPYYKAVGNCLPCPPQEEVGSAPQILISLMLIVAAGCGIWIMASPAAMVADSPVGHIADVTSQVENIKVAEAFGVVAESSVIILNAYQLMANAFAFDFGWPGFVRSLATLMKAVLMGSFGDIASPECVFSYGAYKDDDRYLAVLALKFLAFLLYAFLFGILAVVAPDVYFSDRAINALVTSYSVFLVLIASACFSAIDVTEQPDGNYALKTLPSVTSLTDDFFAMIAYGVVILLLFLVIIPGILLKVLYNSSNNKTLWTEQTQRRFGSIFVRYRAACWWYEFSVMGRKILLAAIAILSGNALTNLILSAVVIAGSLAIHLKYKPYMNTGTGHRIIFDKDGNASHEEDTHDQYAPGDKLEVLCMASLLMLYLVGAISAWLKPEDGSGLALSIIVVALLVLNIPVGGAAAIYKQARVEAGADDAQLSSFEMETSDKDDADETFETENDGNDDDN